MRRSCRSPQGGDGQIRLGDMVVDLAAIQIIRVPGRTGRPGDITDRPGPLSRPGVAVIRRERWQTETAFLERKPAVARNAARDQVIADVIPTPG